MEFTLQKNRWYAYQMLPGYLEAFEPYYSPILVHAVEPLKSGEGKLKLTFHNPNYACGVQGFELVLKVLYRADRYLVADLGYDHRCAVVSELSRGWLQLHCPEALRDETKTWSDALAELYGVSP